MVCSAFRRISRCRLVVEDRGEGLIVLIPPSVSKVDLFDPLIPGLAAALRDHNSTVTGADLPPGARGVKEVETRAWLFTPRPVQQPVMRVPRVVPA